MSKEKMILWLVGTIIARVDEKDVKRWVLSAIEMLKTKVIASPNKMDDMIVLPILDVIDDIFMED